MITLTDGISALKRRELAPIGLIWGSSSITGEGMLNLEEEVLVISEAICGSLDDFDFIIHAFKDTGVERVKSGCQDASKVRC